MKIVNVAAYKFVELSDLDVRRQQLRQLCHQLDLRGTILLAAEGINLFVAGMRPAVEQLLTELQADPTIGPLDTKESITDYQPFNRMLVKIKREIIAFGVEGIAPHRYSSQRIKPGELKRWLDEGREITLLDTRNTYEIELGTFEGAQHLNIEHFRDFTTAAKRLPDKLKEQPVVTFCTGGIRCEKAAPLLERLGFKKVYQLHGGILNYFEQIGGAHYNGDCFVFDQRVAVDAALRETDAAQCYACQEILGPDDLQSPFYVKGESCPRCYQTSEEAMATSIAERHKHICQVTSPLPGSKSYDNYRPFHVAGRFDGWGILEFLCAAVPSVERQTWLNELRAGRILLRKSPVEPSRVVYAGEKYEHLLRGITEPAVNADIRILHEDAELVVVNKPAPLPMHASGRFNKNTLSAILAPVYAPERLRHAHRLDANTTGVVVFARTRRVAKLLQPLFSKGSVQKEYIARVAGQLDVNQFACDVAISAEASSAGVRVPNSNGIAARTEFEVIRRDQDGTSLLKALPITGRTNQIRVHLWSMGMPVVGDPSYQPRGILAERQSLGVGEPPMCLHAWRIRIPYPRTGEPVVFEAPLPDWANTREVTESASLAS